MQRFRANSGRSARAANGEMPDQEYRDGLGIVNNGPFPPAKGNFNPDIGLPTGMEGIYTQAPEEIERVSIPTRIGTLG